MSTAGPPRIVYCHCAFAQVIPKDVKLDVLQRLTESGRDFECVPDLCESSARRDPLLNELARQMPVRIAACYPRAVHGLFIAAGQPLPPEEATIVNLRTMTGEAAFAALTGDESPRPEEPSAS